MTVLGPVTVTNGGVPNSPDWTAVGPAQTDYFVASYSGDTNNASAISSCAADPVTVNANVPTVTTQASAPSVSIGGAVYDTATLSGATPSAGGTMTYSIYSSANCSGLISTLGPVTVANGACPGLAGLDGSRPGRHRLFRRLVLGRRQQCCGRQWLRRRPGQRQPERPVDLHRVVGHVGGHRGQ